MLILGHVQILNCPISHGNAPNFDDLPKTGNYTTPEEIGEMRELQQRVAETQKDADFTALNF